MYSLQNVERGGACVKCGRFCEASSHQGIEAPGRSLKMSKGGILRLAFPFFSVFHFKAMFNQQEKNKRKNNYKM